MARLLQSKIVITSGNFSTLRTFLVHGTGMRLRSRAISVL
ncbi:hypothetical protein USDA257_c57260 [Sinorhizobium fredii USDA 257]|uniref:Uncharacterized protein n=1 Tax=Sinorhizobium fredii (strain USDA 257) TaxID=1185652 RepID=I3XED1_SINF2|nr:hypothetical protein USDA257_c57260 [Sinorhizobium fredii USDA 257]